MLKVSGLPLSDTPDYYINVRVTTVPACGWTFRRAVGQASPGSRSDRCVRTLACGGGERCAKFKTFSQGFNGEV